MATYFDGWVIDSQTDNVGSLTSFSGSWNVPAAPSNSSDQTVYIWIGAQPNDGSAVLQPVLGWTANDGWTVANWYVVNGGKTGTQVGKSYSVNVGDTISGTITRTNKSTSGGATTYTYTSTLSVNGTPTSSSGSGYDITVSTTKELTTPFVVLEGWNCMSCSDYPNATKCSFTSLDVTFEGDTNKGNSWSMGINNPVNSKCGRLKGEIVTNSVSAGAVDIYFQATNCSISMAASQTWTFPSDLTSITISNYFGAANATVTINGVATSVSLPQGQTKSFQLSSGDTGSITTASIIGADLTFS